MSLDHVVLELIVEVVADGAGPGADFDPVVSLVAEGLLGRLAAEHEVVADAAEGFVEPVVAEDDEVLAFVGDDQVDALAGVDGVVTVAATIMSSPPRSVMISSPSPPLYCRCRPLLPSGRCRRRRRGCRRPRYR